MEDNMLKIEKTAKKRDVLKNNSDRLKNLRKEFNFDGIVGNSFDIYEALKKVSKISHLNTTVLITGENGTGKELIAQAIHNNSMRRHKPFVTLNCGAIPDNLHESELFGHKRGAFTNAFYDKTGLLEEAHNGTLLLDEVRELTPSAQVKMLRFLQDGEMRRIGSNTSKIVDVRIIAVTNGNLKEDIKSKIIREDFYYRLNVVRIELPPLRKRIDDIQVLANFYLKKYYEKMQKPEMKISPQALSLLLDYKWPGNIRELKNAIEHAVIFNETTTITPTDFPEEISQTGNVKAIEVALKDNLSLLEVERGYILRALEKCGGHRKNTADLLGITKATLWRKLKEYNCESKEQLALS